MSRHLQFILIMAVLCGSFISSSAQVSTGTPPFGSFNGGPFDMVNLGNLNFHFSIPVVHKAGRGLPFTYDLSYDSSVWYPSNGAWHSISNFGWRGNTEITTGYLSFTVTQTRCPGTGIHDGLFYFTYFAFSYHDPFGASHPFSGSAIDGIDCLTNNSRNLNSTTMDGSGYSLFFPGGNSSSPQMLTAASGQTFIPPSGGATAGAGQVTDENGNESSVNSSGVFTDTLGTTAVTVAGTGTPTSPKTFTYTGPSGPVVFTIHYVNKTVKTNFGCSGASDFGPSTIAMVNDVTLPDGSQYVFQYEDTPGFLGDVTGRMKQVTLPTGGAIQYQYTGANNGIICSDGSAAGLIRILNPGGSWTYARSGASSLWTTTITDPLSNQTAINFSKDASGITSNFYETQRQINQLISGSQVLLATAIECYNAQFANCSGATVSSPITQTDSYTQLPTGTTRLTETAYNGYGLVTDLKQYDYGVTQGGAPGTAHLIRETATSYAGLGNGIVNRPSLISVFDWTSGSQVVSGKTAYSYDDYALSSTSGTPQHIAISGSRGNLTTVIKHTSSTASLSGTFRYYDTGNVKTVTDINGAVTSYIYGACGNSFPTTINEPLSLSRSISYDANCNGAVPVTTTDENLNSTMTTYSDAYYWRPASISFPDGGAVSYTYNLTANPPNIITSTKINSSSNLTRETIFDPFGRVATSELSSDPAGTDYQVTSYDGLGRVSSVTNPYRSTSDPTYGITQYTYDALGRTTQISKPDNSTIQMTYIGAAEKLQNESGVTRVYQSDGLGRLASVCEVTNASEMGTAPSACNQDVAATGFLTAYTHDVFGDLTGVTQGTQTRTYTYDWLARLTSETNPEWNGATNYVYDSCSAGDLCTRTRPAPNQTGFAAVTTTYVSDALHRLTSISYNDGVTPTTYFNYDQTAPWGWNLSNPKGHLTTQGTYLNGWITEELYNYDSVGRKLLDEQCVGLNCAAEYALNYSYDLLGDTTSATNGIGITFGLNYNSAAQPSSLTSSLVDGNHPGTLFSSVQYNALGEPTTDILGNGLPEAWTYDHLGRFIAYNSGPSGTYQYGNGMNWLGAELRSAGDSINGNWSFTYDDFGRLATASCSVSGCTPASFSYQYDRFGNRWQQNVTSGSGPGPQYSFNNSNQPTGFTFDSAGNIMNDGYHSYTYDAESRLISVDSGATATYMYDALGRRVQRSGAVNWIYDLWGNRITEMNAQTGGWNTGEVYAGSRHLATYQNSTTYFPLSDWLGTRRMETDINGSSVMTCVNLPFGDGRGCAGTIYNDPAYFTGQIWDSESALDHFLFRQYTSTQGHWTSPDPAGLRAVDAMNPQTWNRYAYVGNNPSGSIDPTGLKNCPECVFLGYGKGNCNMDGVYTPCDAVAGAMQAGGAVQCPYNSCPLGLTVESNGDMYAKAYNPGTFECSLNSGVCTPTNWVSVFLGNGEALPSNIICVVMGGICDVPLNSRARAVFGSPVLQTAAATMNDWRTYAYWYGGSFLGGLAGGYYAGGEAFTFAVNLGPEIWANIYDFVGAFDPNPAAPIVATFGGVAGWIASGGAGEWADQTLDFLKDWWNNETDMFMVGPDAWHQP